MKTLILVRHAKSSWTDQSLSDMQRPLSERGQRDAPHMGSLLMRKVGTPDIMLSSPAIRAVETARHIAMQVSYPEENILLEKDIYSGGANEVVEILREMNRNAKNLVIVGHNPTITELANQLADCGISHIPTCGVVSITFNIPAWDSLRLHSGRMDFFEYPKKHRE